MKILLLSVFVLTVACAHEHAPTVLNSAAPAKAVEPDAPPTQKVVKYGHKEAAELFTGLKAIGVKPVKAGIATLYTAHDLSCSLIPTGDSGKTQCEYYDAPASQKNRKVHLVKGKEAFEDLRGFLSDFPIEQGDTGAVTHFAECRVYKESRDCFLAIQLNYEGP